MANFVLVGVGGGDLGELLSLLFDLAIVPRDEFCPPTDILTSGNP